MSSQLPLFLVLGLGAGVAGGGIATVLSPASEPAPTDIVDSGSNQDQLLAQLSQANQRIDTLEHELQQLRLSGGGPALREAAAPAEPQVDLADLKAELDAYMASLRNPAAAMPPHFEAWVEAAQDSLQEKERQEREAERAEREAERLEERLAEMQTALGLDLTQVGQMRDTLNGARDKRNQFFSDLREQGWGSMDRDQMRAAMGELRDETNQTLQGFLTPSQYETYQSEYAEDDNGRGGRRGGWGGGGGPGGGGPGGGNGGGGGGGI